MILLAIVILMFLAGAWYGSRKGLIEGIINIVSSILGVVVLAIIIRGVSNFMQGSFMGVLMAGILLLAIRLIHKVINLIMISLKLVRALPAGKLVDKLAGAVLGVVETLILIWFLILLTGSFDLFGLNSWMMEQIQESKILQYIYSSNYLVKFFR